MKDAEALAKGSANDVGVTAKNALPNGDEIDFRMSKIEEMLDHSAMHRLDKCCLVAEWVRHAEGKFAVSGQVVAKPQGGRPEGGVSRAARELPLPVKTEGGRRKFVERALDIDAMWPEAKSAARTAQLDNIQLALLEIAKQSSSEKQLEKVAEIAARKAEGRRRRKPNAKKRHDDSSESLGLGFDVSDADEEVLTADENTNFALLQDGWTKDGALRRADWKKASSKVRRRFLAAVLLAPVPVRQGEERISSPSIVDDRHTPDTELSEGGTQPPRQQHIAPSVDQSGVA